MKPGHGTFYTSLALGMFQLWQVSILRGLLFVGILALIRLDHSEQILLLLGASFVMYQVLAPIFLAKLSHLHEWGADAYALHLTGNGMAMSSYLACYATDRSLDAAKNNRVVYFAPKAKTRLRYFWQWLHFGHRPLASRLRWSMRNDESIRACVEDGPGNWVAG